MISRSIGATIALRVAVAGILLLGTVAIDGSIGTEAQGAEAGEVLAAHAAFDGIWRHAGIGRRRPDAPLGPCCSEQGWDDYKKMLQPWALEIMAKREAALIAGDPLPTNTATCKPDGMPTVIEIPYPFQFLRTPTHTYIIYEADYQSRRIRMNSSHPVNLKPTWYGDSIGSWDGDTLVVDTVAIDARTQLNWDGIPHTDALHIVERYTITKPGEMELRMTLTDPGTLVGPWTVVKNFRKLTETRMLEYVCAQNNRDEAVPTE